ncbi:TPA: hypothetical protein HA265_02020 [Candidatus Woesearchaeota archaeon]|nr:hypothetical protein [Candidatus Woesearchaeota archaeon]
MDLLEMLLADKEVYDRLSADRPRLRHEALSCLDAGTLRWPIGSRDYCMYDGYCSCQEESGKAMKYCLHSRVIRFLSLRRLYDI